MNEQEIKDMVRQSYAKVASAADGCGCGPSCCAPSPAQEASEMAAGMGYSEKEITSAPKGANLGLGCGNPQAIASLGEGETVVDLGSGAGFDAFLAARAVGPKGKVIGVDMTAEMLERARANAEKAGLPNVEFRHGEIEDLPLKDGEADVIISNCVINLSPAKDRVFGEAFRVLKPGGRLAVSDVVALQELPPHLKEAAALYSGCVAGAASPEWIENQLKEAGFEEVRVEVSSFSSDLISKWAPGSGAERYVASASITARKPL